MGGLDPTGGYVRELLRAGKSVVTANKQLVARDGADLFAIASDAGVQLRFEASVCAAIPVVKVLRESLVVSNVHRVLGIVNGTTNFILSRMERGGSYAEALAEAQRLGYAEADPTDDVNGADAAAKMAILATVAFGSRVTIDDVECAGHRGRRPVARRRRGRARDGRAPRRDRNPRRRQGRRARAAGVRRAVASARRGRRRVQRRDAPGRRDPRDHARGPGRGRDRDRVGRRRRPRLRRRHDGHRLPPERRLLARARAAAAGRLAVAVLRAPRRRRPPGRARPRREPARRARGLGRAARPASRRGPGERSSSCCTRRRSGR